MMTRGIEQIPAVSRVNIKEDTRDHNGLFLEEFLKERLEQCIISVFIQNSARGNQPSHC